MVGGVFEERSHETRRTDDFTDENPQGRRIEISYVLRKSLYIRSVNQNRSDTRVGRNETVRFVI